METHQRDQEWSAKLLLEAKLGRMCAWRKEELLGEVERFCRCRLGSLTRMLPKVQRSGGSGCRRFLELALQRL